uniref:Uncharacterized protein n=1 Tax=Oncorhynchus kisutch TaxID=8019 RepID=A0A8C7MCK1_ONCKI
TLHLGGCCTVGNTSGSICTKFYSCCAADGLRCLLPLVDMDGVIADLEGGFLKKILACILMLGHLLCSPFKNSMLLKIYIENKLTLLFSSLFSSTDGFICTSSIKHHIHCPGEKCAWIEKHLNKTMVTGDILIDDTPDIRGESSVCSVEPNSTWEHILFTACHNKKRNPQLQAIMESKRR